MGALLVTSRVLGGPGVGVVLRQLLCWRVGPGWYVVALIGPVLIAFASLGVALLLGVAPPSFGVGALVDAATIVALAVSFVIAEELGWRGYLQASLQRHAPALVAALVVAVVATLWHAPLFLAPEHVQSAIPPLAFVAWITGATVVLAALYNTTGGSIPVVVVAHVAVNASLGWIAKRGWSTMRALQLSCGWPPP